MCFVWVGLFGGLVVGGWGGGGGWGEVKGVYRFYDHSLLKFLKNAIKYEVLTMQLEVPDRVKRKHVKPILGQRGGKVSQKQDSMILTLYVLVGNTIQSPWHTN